MDPMTVFHATTAPEFAHLIRQHAGTACVLRFGNLAMTFREVPAFERLEFHARRGKVADSAKSRRDWWTGADLIQAEGKKAKVPMASQFKTWEAYLQAMHTSRDWFSKYVEGVAKEWDKMPRKAWPRI